jgi:hypothetical protein
MTENVIDRALLEERGVTRIFTKIPSGIKKAIQAFIDMHMYYNVSNFVQMAITEKVQKEIDRINELFTVDKHFIDDKLALISSMDKEQIEAVKKILEMGGTKKDGAKREPGIVQ